MRKLWLVGLKGNYALDLFPKVVWQQYLGEVDKSITVM